ncbi:MAG: class A beta-lactamase [Muribaculaceae bacterium]|nr:class A beta-lactamase [Muribaculaceae bacterium]
MKSLKSILISVFLLAGVAGLHSQSPRPEAAQSPATQPKYSPIATDGSPRPWDVPDSSDPEVILSGPEAGSRPVSVAIRDSLQAYIAGKDARFGVAMLIEDSDTISINGHSPFPMASVYKLPQALAFAKYCKDHEISFSDTIYISPAHLLPDTWSPMRDRYGSDGVSLPISEVLAYSLQESDNNACDVIFDMMGGPATANALMEEWGFPDIRIINTEAEMQDHPGYGYSNTSTPISMALLLDNFDTKHCLGGSEMAEIARLLESCETGKDRLVKPLSKDAVCGHKTGTGPLLPNGRLMAVNDCGYVRRIDGPRYSIAIFIAESGYDMAATEAMICDISRIVKNELKRYISDD